jgi:hypothetical protein
MAVDYKNGNWPFILPANLPCQRAAHLKHVKLPMLFLAE